MYRNWRSAIFNKFQCVSSTELAFNKLNAEISRFIHLITLFPKNVCPSSSYTGSQHFYNTS